MDYEQNLGNGGPEAIESSISPSPAERGRERWSAIRHILSFSYILSLTAIGAAVGTAVGAAVGMQIAGVTPDTFPVYGPEVTKFALPTIAGTVTGIFVGMEVAARTGRRLHLWA